MDANEARKAAVALRADVRRRYLNISRDHTLSKLDRKAACEQVAADALPRMRELRAASAQQAAPAEGSMNERIRQASRGEGLGVGDAARRFKQQMLFSVPQFDSAMLEAPEAVK
jgi:hypothetical protein